MNYILNHDVRILIENYKVTIRKGVWNTVDGIIDASNFKNRDYFINFLKRFADGEKISDDEMESNLNSDELKIVDEIKKSDFIIQYGGEYSKEAIKLLTGHKYLVNDKKNNFTLISDNSFIIKNLEQLQTLFQYDFSVLTDEYKEKLSESDYFSKINSIEYEEKKSHYNMLLGSNPILILLSSINLPLLRNLNHLSSSSRPLFIGFIDGPFVIFLSIISGQTGCWECFEQRMLASLKDHVLYNRFFNLINKSEKLPIYNLQLTNLIHIGLQEVITWNQIEMSKFMGRALFIYLPTYEIHFHNIDRISSCNYCGYISQNIFNLNNIKLDHVLKDYISLNKDK